MLCPECQAENLEGEELCRECGSKLVIASTSLIPAHSHSSFLPILRNPQLPRLAAGVGAVVFGVGFELLRRNVTGRMTKAALRSAPKLLPSPQAIHGLKESLTPPQSKMPRLPKGYEFEETTIYVSRVIRRRK